MLADEASENDEEYDEDIDESEQEDEETWNKLSTPHFRNGIDFTTSTSTTPKTTDSGASTPSLIDPYFTHFDPRSEHQSYKVSTIRSKKEFITYKNLKNPFHRRLSNVWKRCTVKKLLVS